MTTFFTADPHLWHPLVARLRGFADPADWSEQFAQTWREQVGRNDVVWVLGDLALGKWREALQLVADLPAPDTSAPISRCSRRSARSLARRSRAARCR